eukprot:GHVU01073172.1.p1 GENE.GHVU01073172.1~~GHVU01073172.1.p1  ORF type:complete len:115 (+),score=4.04 GHVU01073172.1:666-1010(+)
MRLYDLICTARGVCSTHLVCVREAEAGSMLMSGWLNERLNVCGSQTPTNCASSREFVLRVPRGVLVIAAFLQTHDEGLTFLIFASCGDCVQRKTNAPNCLLPINIGTYVTYKLI